MEHIDHTAIKEIIDNITQSSRQDKPQRKFPSTFSIYENGINEERENDRDAQGKYQLRVCSKDSPSSTLISYAIDTKVNSPKIMKYLYPFVEANICKVTKDKIFNASITKEQTEGEGNEQKNPSFVHINLQHAFFKFFLSLYRHICIGHCLKPF